MTTTYMASSLPRARRRAGASMARPAAPPRRPRRSRRGLACRAHRGLATERFGRRRLDRAVVASAPSTAAVTRALARMTVRQIVSSPRARYASARSGSLILAITRGMPNTCLPSWAAMALRLSPSVSAMSRSAMLGAGRALDVLVGAAAAHGDAAERRRQAVEGARWSTSITVTCSPRWSSSAAVRAPTRPQPMMITLMACVPAPPSRRAGTRPARSSCA